MRYRRKFGAQVLAHLLCLVTTSGHSQNDSYYAVVKDVDSQPVRRVVVHIEILGDRKTDDEGEFSFPAPLGPGVDTVTFHIDGLVIVHPCELISGRAYLPAGRTPIQIETFSPKDPRLPSLIRKLRLVECTIETADADFGKDNASSPTSANSSNRDRIVPTPSRVLRTIAFDPRSTQNANIVALSSDLSCLALSESDSISQSSIDHSDFLQQKAEEYGISETLLKAEVDAWIQTAGSKGNDFDKGLADLYLGDYKSALSHLADDKVSDTDNVEVPILRARAQFGLQDYSGADATLEKFLSKHSADSIAIRARNIVQHAHKNPKPQAPTGLGGGVVPVS